MRNRPGLSAPYRWLGEAVALCGRGWGQVIGGSGLLVAVAVAPSVLQVLLQSALPSLGPALQVFSTVLGLVLMPPALGGFFRLLQSLERGEPDGPGQVLSLYSEGATARRLILCNLLFAIGTVLALLALVYAVGGQALVQYVQSLAAIKPGATAADLPPLPDGILTVVGLMLLVALFVTTAQQLAMAQIALGRGEMLRASGQGAMATLANAPGLLLFYLPMLLVATIAALLFAVVAGIAATMLALLSKGLAVVVGGLFMLALLVPLYGLMLAFFYRAWRAVLATDADAGADAGAPPPPPHQIAA